MNWFIAIETVKGGHKKVSIWEGSEFSRISSRQTELIDLLVQSWKD